ncbi:MAG TPA: c-type cytochrome [Arenicellales bacterium]|nr:c-type cytochrome [Arenicellales bacterium]
MRPLLHVLAVTVCLSFGAAAQAAGDAEKGEQLAQTCMGCHGAPGLRNAYPGYRVPKLGGQHDFYIVSALQAYRAGDRWHPTMQAQGGTLSDQDMEHIAAYFSSLADVPDKSNEVGDNNPAQQCVACHNADGISPSDPAATQGAPILAGQYPDYLTRALLDYQSGKRQNAVMNGMAAGLDQAQIEAIAQFYYRQDGLEAPEISN